MVAVQLVSKAEIQESGLTFSGDEVHLNVTKKT